MIYCYYIQFIYCLKLFKFYLKYFQFYKELKRLVIKNSFKDTWDWYIKHHVYVFFNELNKKKSKQITFYDKYYINYKYQ